MKIKDLKEMLKNVDDKKDLCIIVNKGNPEDDTKDMYYDFAEVWDNSENTADLFIGLKNKGTK